MVLERPLPAAWHLCNVVCEQGFSGTVNAIIENLPAQRQTMLFSATQTRSVKDLARLSLQNPTYISIHAEAVAPTPLKLQQVRLLSSLACSGLYKSACCDSWPDLMWEQELIAACWCRRM